MEKPWFPYKNNVYASNMLVYRITMVTRYPVTTEAKMLTEKAEAPGSLSVVCE